MNSLISLLAAIGVLLQVAVALTFFSALGFVALSGTGVI